jgi:hypothetical protein
MIIVGLAVVGATIISGLMLALVYLTARKSQPLPRVALAWAARLWVFNFLFNLVIFYFFMPALTGPYWGGQWLLWPLLLTGGVVLLRGNVRSFQSALDSLSEQFHTDVGARFSGGAFRMGGMGGMGGRGRGGTVNAAGTRAASPATSGMTSSVTMRRCFHAISGASPPANGWSGSGVPAWISSTASSTVTIRCVRFSARSSSMEVACDRLAVWVLPTLILA